MHGGLPSRVLNPQPIDPERPTDRNRAESIRFARLEKIRTRHLCTAGWERLHSGAREYVVTLCKEWRICTGLKIAALPWITPNDILYSDHDLNRGGWHRMSRDRGIQLAW